MASLSDKDYRDIDRAAVWAKQDPAGKARRGLAGGKCFFSYAQIAATVSSTVPAVEAFSAQVTRPKWSPS